MNRWLFLLSLGALLSAARAELPVDLPADTPTNRPGPGINVPAPLRGATSGTNEITIGTEPGASGKDRAWKYIAPARMGSDTLTLRDFEQLPGRLVAWDGSGLRWEYPGACAPIRFRPEGVESVRMAPVPDTPPPPSPRWLVRLTNGDLFSAEDLTVDARTVSVRTRAAGAMRIPRSMVSALYHDAEPAAGKFRVLQNLDEWERVEESRISTLVEVYRDVNLPNSALIEFDWPVAAGSAFGISLWVGSPRSYYSSPRMDVWSQDGQLRVRNRNVQAEVNAVDPLELPPTRSGFARIGIAVNLTDGTLVVYLDGKRVRQAFLREYVDQTARSLFIQGGSYTDARFRCLPVRRLIISPIGADLSLPEANPDEDSLRFANSDAMLGRIESLGTNGVTFVGRFGRTELPLERLVAVSFATAARQEPPRRAGDATVEMTDGGDMTAAVKEFGPVGLVLESAALGQVTLARAEVRGVRFGPYAPPAVSQYFREVAPGTVLLRPGEIVSGTLVGLSNGMARLQLPGALDVMELAQTNLVAANWDVASGGATNPPALPARVQLVNGDAFRAELLGADRQHVRVRTPYTAEVAVPRDRVAGLRPGAPAEGVIDTGPLERWPPPQGPSEHPGARRFRREFDLPARVCLQFETGGIPDCSRDPDGRYALVRLLDKPVLLPNGTQIPIVHSLSFRYNMASLDHMGMSPTGTVVRGSAQVLLPGLWRRTSMQVTFLADRAKGEMYLLLDGKLALKCLGQPAGAEGRTVEFILNQPPGLRVKDMVLSEWKGTADALTARAPAGDALWLHDQTVLTGPIEGIRDGAVVRGDGEPVPLGRVSRIELESARAVRFRRAANDVRVTLVGGEQLTLNAPQLDERGLTGTSDALGPVCIPAVAVRRLDFRPYDPPPAMR